MCGLAGFNCFRDLIYGNAYFTLGMIEVCNNDSNHSNREDGNAKGFIQIRHVISQQQFRRRWKGDYHVYLHTHSLSLIIPESTSLHNNDSLLHIYH